MTIQSTLNFAVVSATGQALTGTHEPPELHEARVKVVMAAVSAGIPLNAFNHSGFDGLPSLYEIVEAGVTDPEQPLHLGGYTTLSDRIRAAVEFEASSMSRLLAAVAGPANNATSKDAHFSLAFDATTRVCETMSVVITVVTEDLQVRRIVAVTLTVTVTFSVAVAIVTVTAD